MKKILFVLFAISLFTASAVMAENKNKSDEKAAKGVAESKELMVLLTTGEKDVLTKMAAPYLMVSAKSWEKRTLLIWGPAEKTIAENDDIKDLIKKLKEAGVVLKACKWCADQYNVGSKLAELGFEVAYMGTPLTEALQSNIKLLSL